MMDGELEEMATIDDEDVIEFKNEADHIWEEETNFTSFVNSEISVKSEVHDIHIDYISEEANFKETVKKESFEITNNVGVPEENDKHDNYNEIMEKAVKNFHNIETIFTFPGDKTDELHSKIPDPQGSPHCERCDLSFASQEAFDDHKSRSAKHADERQVLVGTVKIMPRFTEPVVYNGVQSAQSPRVALLKQEYVAPPEYAGMFGAPFKKPTADSLQLKNNSKASNEEKFICNDCGRQFDKKHSIILHIESKHVKDIYDRFNIEKIKYYCDGCNNRFTSKILLNRHKQRCDIKNNVSNTRSTVKSYSCIKSGKKSSLKHDFIKHMKTPTDEKPYSCTVCNKQFIQCYSLIRHMSTHAGEKRYSCTVCKKQFIQIGSLNRHNMRTHTGEKPNSCTVCNKQFRQTKSLNYHMRTHVTIHIKNA